MRKMITTLVALLVLMTSQAGELFVKINSSPGSYYATFDNQAIYNKSGIFRFFEVQGGQQSLIIRHQVSQKMVANVPLQIPYNQRMIGEINMHGHFQLIKTEQLHYISWYAQQNPYAHQIPPVVCPQPTIYQSGMNQFNVLNDVDYQGFLAHLDDEAFDSGRLTTAKSFVKRTRLSALQIAGIMDEFTFDDARLDFAKFAYDSCFDPINYYKLDDAFTFDSNADKLHQYIALK